MTPRDADRSAETDLSDLDAFRAEARAWLAEHCVEPYRGLEFRGDPDSDWLDHMRTWNNRLADAGWAGIDWPVEHGGRGLGLAHQVVLAEELDRAGAPGTLNPIGLANIAPSIMAFGTEEQQDRYLRPMLRGDEIWCQGFSEPDAGSDLASLATRGRRDGDDWVISGQKVWNTYGQLADWCELLVRTDPTASKHRGITCFLVDMTLPGIEVRPLRTATGDADFCELFFDEVRVPDCGPAGTRVRGLDRGHDDAELRAQRRVEPAHPDPTPRTGADRRDPGRGTRRRPGRAPGAEPAVQRRPRSSACCPNGPTPARCRACHRGPKAA